MGRPWAGGASGAGHIETLLNFDIDGVGVCGVVSMAAGGRGSSCLHRIVFFCSAVFCKGLWCRAWASVRAGGCPWGMPWGRAARVRARRVWGVGGVVPMAAGGMSPSRLRRIVFISSGCLLQGLQEEQGLRVGLSVALGECHGAEVRVST